MRSSISLSIVLVCASASAQETPQRLVQLSVAATNNKGEPVTDLRKDEIVLREDGKIHPLVFFRFDGSRRDSAPGTPGEFVNRPGITPTVILFDRYNERLMTAASAWDDIGSALERLGSAERIYIYFLTYRGDLYPVHPLPPPDADLRGTAPLPPAEIHARLDEAVRKLNGLRSVNATQNPYTRVAATFEALDQLRREMSIIAGRKNLIWVTHGIPFNDLTSKERLIFTAAALFNIAVYTVDQSEGEPDAISPSLVNLQRVSSFTGGRWFGSGNTGQALTQALADGRGAYRLAYYSEFRPDDHKEHKIHLETRRKDVRFVTREGYYGDIPEPYPNTLEQASLGAESQSPFDASDIGVRVARNGSHFTIRVDPSDILLQRRGHQYQGRVIVMFDLYSNGVFKEASKPVSTDVNLTQDQLTLAQKDGIAISQEVPVTSDIDRIRVKVYDDGLHALGTVTIPLR